MSVREAYNRWADQYDHNNNRTRDLNMQCLRRAELPLAGARVFEAGCGTGLNTEYLASQAEQVVAMDFSEAMLKRARDRVGQPSVWFEAGDVTHRWPGNDDSCDLVVITLVLEHVGDLGPVFTQARRVLHNGGLLYIAELHPYRQLAGGQARFMPEGSDTEEFVPAWNHSVSEFVSVALAAGFDLQRIAEPAFEDDEVPQLLQLWLCAAFDAERK
ncbi:class I SAM-dependent methyltransferase [Wenzhouxiangella sp. XN201]|uniref:class I SAM-dependent methyltransferase n=1 Tax=Wenzhouxiangella sp. XN201 TaxID=2710755 RepID=UPI0013CAA446|nr:class I SAM-dependent methyltransferase [Wenzhouxiangella sp. XN201]NEZ04624.1 class I SAM-dependent methyltransferase [Wenzhouxiangella sp. XN201]